MLKRLKILLFFATFLIHFVVRTSAEVTYKYSFAAASAFAGNDTTIYCNNRLVLNAGPLGLDDVGEWQLVSGTATILGTNNRNATVTGLSEGLTVLRWYVLDTNDFSDAQDNINITFQRPSASNAGTGRIICAPSTTLSGNNPTFGVGTWSVVSGSGVFLAPNSPTSSVTGIAAGINIYRWTVSLPGCANVSTVSYNFNSANGGGNQEVCVTDATLNAIPPTVNFGQWQLVFPPFTGEPSDPQIVDEFNYTTQVTNLAPGRNVFRWITRNTNAGLGCTTSSNSLVTVMSNIVSSASIVGGNQSICGSNALLTANAPTLGTGAWSVLTGTGAFIISATSINATISGLPLQNSVVQWRVSKGICESTAQLTITNNSPSQAQLNTASQVVCSPTAVISAVPPTQGIGSWSVISGTSSITSPTLTTTGVTGIPFGDNYYRWSVSFAGCPASVADAYVNRITPELAAVQNSFFQTCNQSVLTVTALNTSPGLGSWSVLSGNATITGSLTNFRTSVAFASDGQSILQWAISVSGCSPSFANITVNHSFVSIATVVGAVNRTICDDVFTLSGIAPVIGNGTWSIVSGGGNFDNTTFAGAVVSSLSPNANILRWTITNTTFCSSFINTTITNNKPSAAFIASESETICGSVFSLSATSISQGTGLWSVKSGTGSFFSSTSPSTTISGVGFGSNVYRWVVTKGSCTNADSIEVMNNAPSVASARPDSVVCANFAVLRASAPLQGTGYWSVISSTGVIGSSMALITTVTGLSAGQNQFLWSVSFTGCPVSTDVVNISNNQVAAANAGNDTCASIVSGNSPTLYLYANAPNYSRSENGFWTTLSAPDPVTYFPAGAQGPSSTISGFGSGFYRLRWTIQDQTGQCTSSDIVELTVLPEIILGSDICTTVGIGVVTINSQLNSSTNIRVARGEQGAWSYLGNPLISGNTATVTGTGLATQLQKGIHLFSYTARNSNNSSCTAQKQTKVTAISKADAGSDICLTNINSANLVGNSNNFINGAVGGRGVWTVLGTTAAISQFGFETSVAGVVNNLEDGLNQFVFSVFNISTPGCTDSDVVNVTKLTTPSAGADNFLLTSISGFASYVLTANPVNAAKAEIGTWNILPGGTGSSSAVLVSNANPITAINQLRAGITPLAWRITNTISGCSLSDTINLYAQTRARAFTISGVVFTNPTPNTTALTKILTSPNALVTISGEIGSWSLVSTNAPQLPTSTPGSTLNEVILGNLRRGVSVFRWTISNPNFPLAFRSNSDDVSITVMTKALAGNDICFTDTTNFLIGNRGSVSVRPSVGERYSWGSSDGSLLPLNPSSAFPDSIPTVFVSGLKDGSTDFYFSITNTITGWVDRDTLKVTKLTKPVANSNVSRVFLLSSTVTNTAFYNLAANNVNVGVGERGTWSVFTGTGVIANLNASNTTVTGMPSGVNGLRWTILNTVSGCSLSDSVRLLVLRRANAGNAIGFTNRTPLVTPINNRQLVALNTIDVARGETGVWTLLGTNAPELPIYSTTGANVTTLTVSNLRRGVSTFRWIISNVHFPDFSNSSDVTVTILTEAEAGNDTCITNDVVNFQLGNTKTIAIRPTSNERYAWTSNRMGYSPTFASSADSIPLALAENLPLGRTDFYFTITNTATGFSDSDTIVVTRLTKPDAGSDIFLVAAGAATTTTSAANMPSTVAGESGTWSKVNTNNAAFAPLNIPNALVSNLEPGVNTWRWGIRNSLTGCEKFDTVAINVLSRAVATTSGTVYRYTNSNPSVPLQNITITSGNVLTPALVAKGETGRWTLINTNTLGSPTSTTGANLSQIVMSGLDRGIYTLRWTISNTNFPSFTNSSDYSFTVMTKAVAGNARCLIDSTELSLGTISTVQILSAVNERISWSSNRPSYVPSFTDTDVKAQANALPVGKTTFYLTITNTGTGAIDKDSILVTRVTSPNLGANVAVCDTVYQIQPLNGSPIAEEAFTWQKLNGGSRFKDSNYNPVVAPLDTGNNRFRYTISNGSCIFIDTLVVRNNQPYLATVSGLSVSCFTTNYFDGNNPRLQFPTAKGKWQIISQPAFSNAVIVNDSVNRVQINDMIRTGEYQLTWTVINQACSITSAAFKVERQSSISGNAGPSVSICSDSYVMRATLPSITGISGKWELNFGGGFINDINDPNATLTGIPDLETGSQNSFDWVVSLGECLSRYNVIITGYTEPTTASIVGENLELCETEAIYLSTYTFPGVFSGTPKWTVAQGTGTISSVNDKNTSVTGLGYGVDKIVYEISNVNCPVSKDSIIINRYKKPLQFSAGDDKKLCGDTLFLSAQTPDVGIGIWHLLSTTSSLSASTFTGPSNAVANVQSGEYFFKWKVTNGTCSDSSTINYSLRRNVTPARAMADTSVCDTVSLELKGNTPVYGNPRWYGPLSAQKLALANLNDSTATSFNAKIRSFGKTQYLYKIYQEYCESVDTVTIEAIHPPVKNASVKDTAICSDALIYQFKKPAYGAASVSSFGFVPFENYSFDTSTAILSVTQLPKGTISLIYAITQPVCPVLNDTLNITNNKLENAFAGRDTIVCVDKYVLAALPVQNGEGRWTLVSGKVSFEDNAKYNSSISGLGYGENKLLWTISNSLCSAILDTVIISNNKPVNNSTFADRVIFKNEVELSAVAPEFGVGRWRVIKGAATIDSPESPVTTARNIAVGENIFRWSVSAVGCDSSFADFKVTVNDIIIPMLISPNNDGMNQTFEIAGIDRYPNSKLEVFNRWGKLVYKNSNYDNTWDGKSDNNQVLADDTYLYILTLSNGKVVKDFVTIKR